MMAADRAKGNPAILESKKPEVRNHDKKPARSDATSGLFLFFTFGFLKKPSCLFV